MHLPVQVLLLLDLASDNPLVENEIIYQLPRERERFEVLRATQLGAHPGPRGKPENWISCADALDRMIARAKSEKGRDGAPAEIYVAGHAALPAFSMLGYSLSSWRNVTVINRRRDGTWDIAPMVGACSVDSPVFETKKGLGLQTPSEATGIVAVSIASKLVPNSDEIRSFIREQGVGLAGIVQIHTSKELDGSSAPAAAEELRNALTQLANDYPHRTGIALFIAGPAHLALMAGRAINPNVHPGSVLVPNRIQNGTNGVYQLAFNLPWKSRGVLAPLSREPADELARSKVFDRIREGVEDLRKSLIVEDLPPWLELPQKQKILEQLKVLKIPSQFKDDAFFLGVAEGQLNIGAGLLEALRGVALEDQTRIGQSILLHELAHIDQDLLSTTYLGVGRAGVALEEIDYWADAAAIGSLASWEIRRGGLKALDRAASEVGAQIDAALRGLTAFDRMEQGNRLEHLPERRLRRYLIWALQRVRADTVRTSDDVWELFKERLFVELAPLEGSLDERYDKIVRNTKQETELFVVLGRRLARIARDPNFDPASLVARVRSLDVEGLVSAMRSVRDKHRPLLYLQSVL